MYKSGKNLTLKDSKSIFIGENVKIGNDVTIYENNRIEGDTIIGDGVTIYPFNHIVDSKIGSNAKIGPFARLRPNTIIENDVKIGNFVEVKNSKVGENSKVSHLAYVGDCEIGKNCNIGCGVIFVNYNGKTKNKTYVGNNCFIGSNCNVIAPVNIEDNSYICAGTTITDKVESGDFVIGRVRQENKKGRAKNYLKGND